MEPTISVQDLKARLWHGIDVTLVDVRRAAAREADPRLIPGAVWRHPEQVAAWAKELPREKPVSRNITRLAGTRSRALL